ncbi:MAG: putative holliday junction resolvase [Candidatus Peregrinibacteria bacterium Gr01-1014_25]|nr:MAG: putative holliday junction resolvase [Candidatus Peregrinibacteria bacterium Gr01-1014_25]
MRLLSLDVGGKRTGVAYYDDATDIVLPLDTITHPSDEMLIEHVRALCSERNIDRVIVGLPLLPSGKEGAQSRATRAVADRLQATGIDVLLLDERYTTEALDNPDAAAACTLLRTYIERKDRGRS